MFVCLAAGRGERMKPMTNYLHKAMIPFSGLPFLAYSLLAIPAGSEVVIIVNYLSDQIRGYFNNRYHGRTIRYLQQRDPRGTGDALFQFSQAYHPRHPVVVWQGDQLIFPDEIEILSRSEPNAAIWSDTPAGLQDLGLWKILPGTLEILRSRVEDGEYRALPILKEAGLTVIKTSREKLEISYGGWEKLERACLRLKQKFHIESP